MLTYVNEYIHDCVYCLHTRSTYCSSHTMAEDRKSPPTPPSSAGTHVPNNPCSPAFSQTWVNTSAVGHRAGDSSTEIMAVGSGFSSRSGHTKDHHKNGTDFLPAWHAMR